MVVLLLALRGRVTSTPAPRGRRHDLGRPGLGLATEGETILRPTALGIPLRSFVTRKNVTKRSAQCAEPHASPVPAGASDGPSPTALAADGWNLVVDARDGHVLAAARAEIDAAGPGDVVALTGHVEDPSTAGLAAPPSPGALGPAGEQCRHARARPCRRCRRLGRTPGRTLRTNMLAPLGMIQALSPISAGPARWST